MMELAEIENTIAIGVVKEETAENAISAMLAGEKWVLNAFDLHIPMLYGARRSPRVYP